MSLHRPHTHPARDTKLDASRMFFGRDCVSCDSDPVCNCATGEQCILTSRTCSQCPTIQCLKNQSKSSGGGINPGVIAGPVVAVLVVISLALFWWLRKKKRRDMERLEDLAKRARKAEAAGFQLSQPGSPQPPSSAHSDSLRSYHAAQLSAPPPSASRRSQRSPLPPAPVNAEYYDENGTTIKVYRGNGTINLDPKHPDNGGPGDPFADRQSISTNGSSTHSTNIIPIQYIPPSKSDEGISLAARTLDEARQNLFKPKQGIPRRPARSPDLDLRLNPPPPAPGMRDSRSPGSGRIRESYLSENSGAPSFLSGNSYDVYNDAPKIVTSKQVHVGRLHQAEVVQLQGQQGQQHGQIRTLSPTGSQSQAYEQERNGAISPGTFGARALTPTSPRGYGDHEEGLTSDEPSSAESTDLRFSMGSLAYRDSVSTMGTSRYLAHPESSAVPPPRSALFAHQQQQQQQRDAPTPRESMFSTKSNADSFLSGFPMIPPGQGNIPRLPSSTLPQSTSIATLDHAAVRDTPARPPPSYRPPPVSASTRQGQSQSQSYGTSRPVTATSIADSVLNGFPFVPPNPHDLAELPSATLPSAAFPETVARQGQTPASAQAQEGKRNVQGMSTTSEGLGGFEFSFGAPGDGDVPPVPQAKQ